MIAMVAVRSACSVINTCCASLIVDHDECLRGWQFGSSSTIVNYGSSTILAFIGTRVVPERNPSRSFEDTVRDNDQ